MRQTWLMALGSALFLCGASIFGSVTLAQVMSNSGSLTPPSSRVGADASPLTADNTNEITNSQERADFNAFVSISPEQVSKKIKAGENFLKKYNDSRLRGQVYSLLTVLYIQAGDQDKGCSAGAKALQLNPKDVRTMGVLSQSIARSITSNTPDTSQKLAQAENYAKDALTTTPALVKPEGVSDQAFDDAKKETLAMAHSGLGLVHIREGKFADAIPDLQQAIQLDVKKDPTNLYLLGVANQNSSRYADAAAAFTQCAAIHGALQPTCQSAADEARKRAGSQSSSSQ